MFLFKPHRYQDWYIACTTHELRDSQHRTIARMVLGIPLVLFRGSQGQPIALMDRCPHRNVPLSSGRLQQHVDGEIASRHLICPYHGWRFDEQGHCQDIPGCPFVAHPSRNAIAYPVIEQQGFIWVYPIAKSDPNTQPYRFPWMEQTGFSTFGWQMQTAASLENVAENFLDAAHTHFVHAGLIRTAHHRRTVSVQITRGDRQVEAVYANEQQISGLLYRLLAPGCREVVSIGRFLLPGVAQIEYQTDLDYRLLISLFITPIDRQQVRAYSVVTFYWGLPNWMGRLIAQPLFYQAMRQDLAILQSQTKNLERFGGEQFVYTPLDLLRPYINDLLQSDGESSPSRTLSRLPLEQTISIQL